MKKDNKTDNSKALATTPKKAIEKVGNLIALTDKLLLPTFDKWAWWNALSEQWKSLFKEAIEHPVDDDISEVDLDMILYLSELELVAEMISDISPLAELNNLTELGLLNNQISDISPLAELKKLKKLELFNNRISDISPLTELNNLTRLYIFNNQIKDISPLEKLNIKDFKH